MFNESFVYVSTVAQNSQLVMTTNTFALKKDLQLRTFRAWQTGWFGLNYARSLAWPVTQLSMDFLDFEIWMRGMVCMCVEESLHQYKF